MMIRTYRKSNSKGGTLFDLEDVPELSAGFQSQAASSLGNLVIRGDVALAANTIENNEGYRQHVDEFTQSQTDAINRQIYEQERSSYANL